MFSIRARTSVLRAPARTLFARFESTEAAPQPLPTWTDEKPRRRRAARPPMARVARTHFLTMPLYEHSPDLRSKIAAFRDSIVASGIQGLTADCVAPRLSHFLELRLGSVNIEGFDATEWSKRRPHKGQLSTDPSRAEEAPIPLSELQEVLEGLKAPIQEILAADGGDGMLRAPLGVLRPLLHGPRDTFNPQKVNLLFLEPAEGPATKRLRAVNQLVFDTLYKTGMWVDLHRPSTLSMTLVNVRYLKGRAVMPYPDRVPFDLTAFYESEAFRAVAGAPPTADASGVLDAATPRPVVLGEGVARSLHIVPVGSVGTDEVAEADEPAKPDWKLEL